MGQVKRELMKVLVKQIDHHEVQTGDILVMPRGKTFFVTGWDIFTNLVHGQTTCSQHYFVSLYPEQCGCSFVDV